MWIERIGESCLEVRTELEGTPCIVAFSSAGDGSDSDQSAWMIFLAVRHQLISFGIRKPVQTWIMTILSSDWCEAVPMETGHKQLEESMIFVCCVEYGENLRPVFHQKVSLVF